MYSMNIGTQGLIPAMILLTVRQQSSLIITQEWEYSS